MKRSSTKHSSGFYEDMKTSNATSTNGESSTSDDSFTEHNGCSSSRARNSPPPLIPAIRSESEIITIDDDSDDDQMNRNIQAHEDEENDVSFDYNDYENNNESSSPDRHLASGRGESNGSGGNRDSAGSSVVFVEDAANLELEQISRINTAVVLDPSEKVSAANFKLLKLLGTGAYGRVYLVQKIDGIDKGAFYAMKILEKEKVTKKNKTTEHTRTEREVLERIIDCPFLATLNYAFQTAEKLYLVLDFVQGGELFSHLYKTEYFSETQVRFYIAEIIVALEQLHDINIIYRDIKLENILLDKLGHIVITDFGLSKELTNGKRAHSYCGTIEYMAPEIVSQNKEGHDLNVDWWSVGVLIIELLTGQSPFSREGEESHQGRISERIRNQPPTIPATIGKDARDLILKLLEKNPKNRLGFHKDAEELKNHKFFKKINWKRLKEKAIEAPMKPAVDGDDDVRQFSEDFTREEPRDEPGVPLPHANAANLFRGYSFVAPHLRRPRPATAAESQPERPTAEPQPESLNRPSLHSVLKAQQRAKSKFFSKYQIEEDEEPIGDGTYSICMRCTSKETGVKYAVKIMNKLHDPSQELEALRQCGDHPNIVKLIEDLEDTNFRYIIFELLSGGELFSRIREHNHFSEETARVFFKQLVDAVKFMHDRGIVHRDLKPENIMFISEDEQSQLKIVDFGFARKKTSEETSPCFTLDYAAPESLSKGTTKESRDMWSLGVILYTMLVGHTPFMPQHINKQTDELKYRKQLTENISKGLYNQKSENFLNISDSARSLISSLLEVDEAERYNLSDLYDHPWLTDSSRVLDAIDHMDNGANRVAEEPITIDDDSTDDSSGIVLSERNEGSSTSSHAEAELIMAANKMDSCEDQPQVQLPADESEVERVVTDGVQEIAIPVEAPASLEAELQEVSVPAELKVVSAPAEVNVTKAKPTKATRKPKKKQQLVKVDLESPELLLEMPSLVPFELFNGSQEAELPPVLSTLVESSSEECLGFKECEADDTGMWKHEGIFRRPMLFKVPITSFKQNVAPKPRGRPKKVKPVDAPVTKLVKNPANPKHSKLRESRSKVKAAVVKSRPAAKRIEILSDFQLVAAESSVEDFSKVPVQAFKPEAPQPTKRGPGRPKKVKLENPAAGAQLVINPVNPANVPEAPKKRPYKRKALEPEMPRPIKKPKREPKNSKAVVVEEQERRYPSRTRATAATFDNSIVKRKRRRPEVEETPETFETNVSEEVNVGGFNIQYLPSLPKRGRPPKILKTDPTSKPAIRIINMEVIQPPMLPVQVEPQPIASPAKRGRPKKEPLDPKTIVIKPARGRPPKSAANTIVLKRQADERKPKRQVIPATPLVIILEKKTYSKPNSTTTPQTFFEYRAMMEKKHLSEKLTA